MAAAEPPLRQDAARNVQRITAAAIDVFSRHSDGRFARAVSRHEQRHHPRAEIEATGVPFR